MVIASERIKETNTIKFKSSGSRFKSNSALSALRNSAKSALRKLDCSASMDTLTDSAGFSRWGVFFDT